MDAGDLLCIAADKVPIGARLAGLAMVAVPADADNGTFLELLGCRMSARLHDLRVFSFGGISHGEVSKNNGAFSPFPSNQDDRSRNNTEESALYSGLFCVQ